jgi:hypothetical protein
VVILPPFSTQPAGKPLIPSAHPVTKAATTSLLTGPGPCILRGLGTDARAREREREGEREGERQKEKMCLPVAHVRVTPGPGAAVGPPSNRWAPPQCGRYKSVG